MRLSVIGSGYVGTVAGACFAELGHEVTVIDRDEEKIGSLQQMQVPFYEHFLLELIRKHAGKQLHFSTDLVMAVGKSEAVFIAVGTPPLHNGEADLSHVDAVVREVSRAITKYTVIIEKSTVPVLTSTSIRKVLSLNGTPHSSFDVVSNPEFLREGTAVTDFLYPDRIVVGSPSDRATEVLKAIYGPLIDGSYYKRGDAIAPPSGGCTDPLFLVTDPVSAELIKHASNSFLAMKISYINAVANICEVVGADIEQVCRGLGSDSRIGQKFLSPGIGYGGSCFPKDVAAFNAVARACGFDFGLLSEVAGINEEQLLRFVRKIKSALWTLREKKIAVLGLAYKGGTDDLRESPAIAVVRLLLKEGCCLTAYDPAAMERAKQELLGDRLTFASGPYEAVSGAEAMIILTDWEEFGKLDLARVHELMKYPIIIDGRNLYSQKLMEQAGFIYHSVGRSETRPVVLT